MRITNAFAVVALSLTVPALAGGQSGTVSIDTRTSLFLAGGNSYTTPVFGGAGLTPSAINLSAGAGRVLTLTAVGSSFFCTTVCLAATPDGPAIGATDVQSSGSIAGMVSMSSGYLAALFLGPSLPAVAPSRLAMGTELPTVSPALGQTFFVGNGVTTAGVTQQFFVPDGATRLYFGIIDGSGFFGVPSFYDDNVGTYQVTYEVTAVPEPATLMLTATGAAALFVRRRRREG